MPERTEKKEIIEEPIQEKLPKLDMSFQIIQVLRSDTQTKDLKYTLTKAHNCETLAYLG